MLTAMVAEQELTVIAVLPEFVQPKLFVAVAVYVVVVAGEAMTAAAFVIFNPDAGNHDQVGICNDE